MNEEIDEYDIYHQDFTTVSEWEVFVARIEEILNDWKLSKSKILSHSPKTSPEKYSNKWLCKSEVVKFSAIEFTLSLNILDTDQSVHSEENNAKSLLTNLHNGIWESTTKFIDDLDAGPYPVSSWFGLKRYLMLCPNSPLTDGNLIKLVLSSMNIAFANIDCGVPFFLKLREHWQPVFLGIYEDDDFRISFDTIHLKRISAQCSNLSSLGSLFKSKIASNVALNDVVVSAKFSYELKDIDVFAWKGSLNTNEFLSIDGFNVEELLRLPFGPENNPIKSIQLNAIWPKFRESCIVDCASYTEIDPLMAPIWTINIKMKNSIQGQLSEIIEKIMALLDNNNLIMDTLGLSKQMGILNPLQKITEAPITISKLFKAAIGHNTNISEFKGPISDDLLMPLLYYIFPDAEEGSSRFMYTKDLEVDPKQKDKRENKLCSYVISSPADGLVWRLSVAGAQLYNVGGMPYLAHLWYEFLQELQYRWEHQIPVPGVADGEPNPRSCLLHQKLQLLNICIRRAASRSAAADSSEEEFFDCSEEEGGEERPAGRLRRLEGATLSNGEPLYIPRTQDPPPKTEDQLEEDTELMVRLGDDARASQLRARMMSASLLSDMEAFKAANPGAALADFVRWYSPRDWCDGRLSERMLLPGNSWHGAWASARPVPAVRQRRLFDETREAEQALHYLRSRTVDAVAELMLPALLRAGAALAFEKGVAGNGTVVGGVDKRRVFEIAARELHEAERQACRGAVARAVLAGSAEGEPLEPDARQRIAAAASAGALQRPSRREFTLKVRTEDAPQVLRAAVAEDMFIVAAFTERTACL